MTSKPLVAVLLIVVSIQASWKYAVDVFLGHAAPYHNSIGPLGLLLALAGYLVVPAVIGSVTAVLLGRAIERSYRDAAVDEVRQRVLSDLRDDGRTS